MDTLHLDRHFASIGLLVWATAGKDPGLTPALIVEQANRFDRLRPEDFLSDLGTAELDFRRMKVRRLNGIAIARELITALPPAEVGVLYLDESH